MKPLTQCLAYNDHLKELLLVFETLAFNYIQLLYKTLFEKQKIIYILSHLLLTFFYG